jgi:hypothetical protein
MEIEVVVTEVFGNGISRDAACIAARRMGYPAMVIGKAVRVAGPVDLKKMKELTRQAVRAEKNMNLAREMKINRRIWCILHNTNV